LDEPESDPSIVKGICCQCSRYEVFNFAKRVLAGAMTSKANVDTPAVLLTNKLNFNKAEEETLLSDNTTDCCVVSTAVNGSLPRPE
jgi:hypothetical protein